MLPTTIRLRSLFVLMHALVRGAMRTLETSSVVLRVWPQDLHLRTMSASSFAVFMEVAVNDLIVRVGIGRQMLLGRWVPVVRAQTLRHYRAIRLWARCTLLTNLIAWSEEDMVIRVTFLADGEVKAVGQYLVRFYERGVGRVPTTRVFDAMGSRYGGEPAPVAFEQALSTFGALDDRGAREVSGMRRLG